MAAFDFVALDSRGRTTRGVVEADSARGARQAVREKDLLPIEINPTRAGERKHPLPFVARKLGAGDLALLTRQLATLLKAGIPLEEALHSVARQAGRHSVQRVLHDLTARIREGQSLAQALATHPGDFSSLYRATVAAGERSGHLDLVLEQLADFTERASQFRQQIGLALVYPSLLVILSILIVTGLMIYVVPDMLAVITDAGQELPLPTRVLMWVSETTGQYGIWLVLLGVVTVTLVHRLGRHPPLQLMWHRCLLRAWPVRGLSAGLNTSRYASTLAILLRSGIALSEAMPIAGAVCANLWFRKAVDVAAQKVVEGRSLNRALEETGYFSPMLLQLVASGERSGDLAEMLARAADNQEVEIRRKIAVLVALFEPGTLLLMGALVLAIVLAVLLPIFNLNQLVN